MENAAGMELNRLPREPWDGILASAGPRDHIVQLYQDQAVSQSRRLSLCRGRHRQWRGYHSGATAAHWEAFRPRLEAEGVDVEAAQDAGSLPLSMPMSFCRAS